MALKDEIETMRKEIRTDGYGMSIGEWMSLYENNEIDIHPEFQRFYRWDDTQKSNLIESILLGIPIPPVFVSQRKDGVWDVIDGLQRLSTIYQFTGLLKDTDRKLVPPLALKKTKYLQSLENKLWHDPNNEADSLTVEQRLIIKRAKIDVSIVLRESDRIAKYELFQRLNTGGSSLTPQEMRNCILVMVEPSFYEWLRTVASYEAFQNTIALSDKNKQEQYDLELALRFLVFSDLDLGAYDRSLDVGEYLTVRMVQLAEDKNFNRNQMQDRFRVTFEHLLKVAGDDSFRRYDGQSFKGGFLLSPFEVIAFGLGFNYRNIPSIQNTMQKIKDLYRNETYMQWSGSGVRANSRLPNLIPLGREIFKA